MENIKEITENCKRKAEELKVMLDTAFSYLRQKGVLVTVEIDEFEVTVNIDGEFVVIIDYREKEDNSLLSLECVHELIKDFEYDLYSIEYDAGCRYHSDGSGTPPSEDLKEIKSYARMVSVCDAILTNYMVRRISDIMQEIEMKT